MSPALRTMGSSLKKTSGQHTHEYMRKPSVDVIKVGPWMDFFGTWTWMSLCLGVGAPGGGGETT